MRQGWVEERQGKRGLTLRARYWVPDEATGEPAARSKSFLVGAHANRREAEAAANLFLAKVMADQDRGTFVAPTKMSLGELVDTYISGKVGAVEGATVHNLRKARRHLPNDIAGRPVQSLTALHLIAMLGRLREAGASPAVLAALYRLVKAALARAVDWGLIPRSPMKGIPAPEYQPTPKVPWTAEHVGIFLEATIDHPLAAYWRLALLTGMRGGELRALRWSDVDLEGGWLRVERTTTLDEHGRVVMGDGPKTDRSRRRVPLPTSCAAALERQRSAVQALRASSVAWSIADGDLVFPRRGGGNLHAPAVGTALSAEIARLGLPPLTAHGMRHTCATILMLEGTHPTAVADLLGDTVETLMRTYAHVLPDHRRAAVDAIERLVTGMSRHKHATT